MDNPPHPTSHVPRTHQYPSHPNLWPPVKREDDVDDHPHLWYPVDVSMDSNEFDQVHYLPHPSWHNEAACYPPQPPHLLLDTDPSSFFLPYSHQTDILVDSPMSDLSPHDIHHYPLPSLHAVRPLPPGSSRSYTLEGAVTPISPMPRAATVPSAPSSSFSPMSSLRLPARNTQSPPPMDSLRPPSPAPLPAPQQQSATAEYSTAPPTNPDPASQKRPRGRPRKNHPRPEPASPPPVVDYPFPQFPPSAPSTSTNVIADAAPAILGMEAMEATGPGQAIFKLNMAATTERADAEGESAGPGEGSAKEGEKKKPIMACLFCRERKIACGPPAPGGPVKCNQCTRRGLVCEYPKESRRGQHKRGARVARIEALASSSGTPSSSTKGKAKGKQANTTAIAQQPTPASTMVGSSVEGMYVAPSSPLTPLPSPGMHPQPLPSISSPTVPPVPPVSSPSAHYPHSTVTPVPSHANPVERKSRPEKLELARGKERSASCSRSRTSTPTTVAAGKEAPWEGARRAVQRQQLHILKRRTAPGEGSVVGSGAVGAMEPMGTMSMAMAMGLGAAGMMEGAVRMEGGVGMVVMGHGAAAPGEARVPRRSQDSELAMAGLGMGLGGR